MPKEKDDDEERRRRKEERRRRKEQEGGESSSKSHKSRDHGGDDDDEERRRRKEERRRRKEQEAGASTSKPEKGGDDEERRHRKHREHRDRDREHRDRGDERDEDKKSRRHREHREKDEDRDVDKKSRRREHRDKDDDEDKKSRRREHREKDDNRDEDKKSRRREHREKDDDRNEDDRQRRRHHRGDDDDDDNEDKKSKKSKEDDRKSKKPEDDDKGKSKDKDKKRKESTVDRKESSHKKKDETEEERKKRKEREKAEKKREEEKKKEGELIELKRKQEEEEEAYGYDDDFEDYDEDFEDDDEDEDDEDDQNNRVKTAALAARTGHSEGYYKSFNWDANNANKHEVDEVLKAMNEENERLVNESKQPKQSATSGKSQQPARGESKKQFINFQTAKERQKLEQASSKIHQRSETLKNLIELDVARFNIFDMPPISEYELYMRTFGSSSTKQEYVQTNEDNLDREIQTDEIETRDKWSQHPPEDLQGVGGDGDKAQNEDASALEEPLDTLKLVRFLRSVERPVCALLEEAAWRRREEKSDKDKVKKQKSNIVVSEGFVTLETVPALKDRHVTCSYISPVQTHMILTAYSQPKDSPKQKSHPLASRGMVCVWNANQPSQPHQLLICESVPTCCCFSPNKPTLAFAGMEDGSLCLWDLLEYDTIHKKFKDKNETWSLRYPTYSTAYVLQNDNHKSSVLSVVPIVAQGDAAGASGDDEQGGMNFQIATLEQNATINLWVVVELSGTPDPAGSAFDLGLTPGGRFKLARSSTISLDVPVLPLLGRADAMDVFDLALLPANNSHYYVTTGTGCVVHGVRYGGRAPPKFYRPEVDSQVPVTSIDFSPFSEPVFLVGCADGSLRLYHADVEVPLLSWPYTTDGAAVTLVRWCRSRPMVFFVLDAKSRLAIWDLSMSDASPMKVETVSATRVTSLSLSNDFSATGQGMPGRKPVMLVCLESGATEVHTISQQFSALMPEEVDQFAAFLQQLF